MGIRPALIAVCCLVGFAAIGDARAPELTDLEKLVAARERILSRLSSGRSYGYSFSYTNLRRIAQVVTADVTTQPREKSFILEVFDPPHLSTGTGSILRAGADYVLRITPEATHFIDSFSAFSDGGVWWRDGSVAGAFTLSTNRGFVIYEGGSYTEALPLKLPHEMLVPSFRDLRSVVAENLGGSTVEAMGSRLQARSSVASVRCNLCTSGEDLVLVETAEVQGVRKLGRPYVVRREIQFCGSNNMLPTRVRRFKTDFLEAEYEIGWPQDGDHGEQADEMIVPERVVHRYFRPLDPYKSEEAVEWATTTFAIDPRSVQTRDVTIHEIEFPPGASFEKSGSPSETTPQRWRELNVSQSVSVLPTHGSKVLVFVAAGLLVVTALAGVLLRAKAKPGL